MLRKMRNLQKDGWQDLTQTISENQMKMWQFLVRDSKYIKLDFPLHELEGYNFSNFIYNFIRYNNSTKSHPFFQAFCIQSIKNNPQLILNRHYVGNSGNPAYQLISTYLVRRCVNGNHQLYNQAKQVVLYNIFESICLNYIHNAEQGHNNELRHSLQIDHFTTTKTVQTVALILQTLKSLQSNQTLQNNQQQQVITIQNQFSQTQLWLQPFLRSLIKMSDLTLDQGIDTNGNIDGKEIYQEQQCIRRNKVLRDVWQLLNCKYQQIVQLNFGMMIKLLVKPVSIQLIRYLLGLQNFRRLILGGEFVFQMFSRKLTKLVKIVWQLQDQRQAICSMTRQGKNLLENVAQNRGLTHNLISILWETKMFEKMPFIRNSKSRSIIAEKYNFTFDE